MGEHFDLRFVPTLILNQRTLEYYFSDGSIDEKDVESVFLHAPVHLKFKSIRHQNIRVYVIGGGSFSYDMASNFEAEKNPFDPFVAVYPNNINYEFGIGLDLYFEYFKFSPEIKISRGLNDVLVPDPGSVYTESFNQMYSNFIMVSFMFE